MRVLLVEPWLGGSHRRWAEGLARSSRHRVDLIGLEPMAWRWRLRAGAVPLARSIRSHVAGHGPPAVLLVSGLVDVASLLGLLRHSIPSTTGVVTYMHESQLLYPTVDGGRDESAVLANWRSWCASDAVVFNSAFHRDAVVEALPRWLETRVLDDQRDELAAVTDRFAVLPVGIDPPGAAPAAVAPGPPVVLWPHRWEPDKRPDVFARAVDRLAADGVEFRLVLAGEDPSDLRAELARRHADRIAAVGPFDRPTYEAWVAASDVVVSCAAHDFFGVSEVEATAAGCVPVLPDALAYPEVIDRRYHDAVLYRPGSFGTALGEVIRTVDARRERIRGLAGTMENYEWGTVAPEYDRLLAEMAERG